jgi:Mor family transcriptional regulator
MIHARIEEIVRVIGLPAALELLERFGGTSIYLPHPSRVKPDSALAQAIGMEAACRLASAWPQCEIGVPRGLEYARRERDRAIRSEPPTMTLRDLARKYGLTERRIQQIRAETEADPSAPEGLRG